ncbi:MAG: hypothetical protein U0793_30740 [Gemmataceae bacterium]
MAPKTPIEVRGILLFEKASCVDNIWTLHNAICSLVEVTAPVHEIFVYTQLAAGVGTYDLRIQLRAFDSDFVIGLSESHRVQFPDDRSVVLEQVFRLSTIRFPRSELYEFRLIANHKDVAGGVYYLSVQLAKD